MDHVDHLAATRRPALDDAPADRRQPRRWPWILGALLLASAVGWLALRGDGTPEAAGRPGDGGPGGPTAVRAGSVSRASLVLRSGYPGEVVGEAVELAPKVGGRLQRVLVRPGERVSRGQVVAEIDPVDLARDLERERGLLAAAEAEQRRAAAASAEAAADLERSRELFAEKLLSAQALERAEARAAGGGAELAAAAAGIDQARARVAALEQQVADARLRTPFAGTVAARHLDPGAIVQPGTPVLRIVEDGPLFVQFRVPERDLAAVRPGAPLTVQTQATGDEAFAGKVLRVAGEISRTDRTALVEGVLEAPSEVLRPGMFAQVEVALRRLDDVLTVPGAAIVERVDASGDEEAGVFVVAPGEPAAARWVPVEVLGDEEGATGVAGDLEVGDAVLTLGHQELRDGSPVLVVEARRDPAPGAGR